MKLSGKTVIITGAGSGIGRACAIGFAGEGAKVIVADINQAGADITVAQIKAAGGDALAFKTDVSDEISVGELAAFARKAYGPAFALVNNAAIQVNKSIANTSLEEWNRQLAINLGGVFLVSKYFLPQLRETSGSIVNMSSLNGLFAEPDCAGYCATKGGIIALTKAMAMDHGHEGIRVNCICPGYIDSGLAEGYFQSQPDPAQARKDAGKLHAIGRIGKPEEVARMAVFLTTADASFITGASMMVDGGLGSGIPRS